jgi:hypothetical protein
VLGARAVNLESGAKDVESAEARRVKSVLGREVVG